MKKVLVVLVSILVILLTACRNEQYIEESYIPTIP